MDFCQYIVNLFIKQLPTSFLPSGAHGLFGLNTPQQLWRIRHLRPCAPLIWALLVPLGTSFLVMFCFKTFYLYKLFSGVLYEKISMRMWGRMYFICNSYHDILIFALFVVFLLWKYIFFYCILLLPPPPWLVSNSTISYSGTYTNRVWKSTWWWSSAGQPTLAPSSCQTCNVTKCELVKDGSKREIIHCSMILKPLNGGESKEDAQRTLVGFLWRWPVDAHYYSMVPLIWLKGHLITASD